MRRARLRNWLWVHVPDVLLDPLIELGFWWEERCLGPVDPCGCQRFVRGRHRGRRWASCAEHMTPLNRLFHQAWEESQTWSTDVE